MICLFISSFVAYVLIFFFVITNKSISKTNNCPFSNKITQDFAEFWEICGSFKAKIKTEVEGILKRRILSSLWFLLFHINQEGWRDNRVCAWCSLYVWCGLCVCGLCIRVVCDLVNFQPQTSRAYVTSCFSISICLSYWIYISMNWS